MATFVITPLPASCPRCGCIDTFEFRRRQIANYWRVSRQCRVCGQTDDNGVRNADHPGRHTYPLFDLDLADRWQAEHWAEARAERVREWEARRADYAAWLATDSELRDLRTRVLKRDHYLCAACLVRRAFQVHHRTYAFGRLPPAFDLTSVCRQCHARLHGRWADDMDQARVLLSLTYDLEAP